MPPQDSHGFFADLAAPFCALAIKPHFEALDHTQKLYAHHLSRASFEGTRIILRQTTPHAEDIYDLIIATFSAANAHKLTDIGALKAKSGVSDEDFEHVLQYSAQFLSNLANYKSFGDSKFVPRASADAFEKVIAASENAHRALPLWNKVKAEIYELEPEGRRFLGYPDQGHVIGYYSENFTKKDIDLVQAALEANDISSLNTRAFKHADGTYEVRVASAQKGGDKIVHHNGTNIRLVFGDFSDALTKVSDSFRAALPSVANEHEKKMVESYIETFTTGSIEAHKESQREWIKDIGPMVESNIGFVETYRDPAGLRAEWEGFVAMVNKEQTAKFEKMVQAAPKFIPLLPWGAVYEKDSFFKPDFTSLEVLSFATGGIPAGINIPNYDDIRQTLGFKNVSLGNVLSAKAPSEKIPFLTKKDYALFEKLRGPAFEVQVGIHELLGHGTGKLLQEFADGTFNFDHKNPPISPVTGEAIKTWYKPNQTWGSVFGAISSSYEECRAEAVGLYLSTDKDMLKIFGHTDESVEEGIADDVMYINWLIMARAGLIALEFYDPVKGHGQAHMRARFALLKAMMEVPGFVTIDQAEDGSNVTVTLERSLIRTKGMKAISAFLQKLQVYKSTADVEAGAKFYNDATHVEDHWLKTREIVLKHKQPRKVFVQANTFVGEGKDDVLLKEYEASSQGMIASWIERQV
ncbi:hypothetical protein DFQ26_007399 [Actinomortierella ambigua]|nr:hypothetical protein DFQ26_007399 [Actinomortierella ambigua]